MQKKSLGIENQGSISYLACRVAVERDRKRGSYPDWGEYREPIRRELHGEDD